MNAMPQPRPDHTAPAAPSPHPAETKPTIGPVDLADAISTAPGASPPHLLWATLESAYAAPQHHAAPEEERLAPYIALPLAIGISLMLWVIIVELVMMR